MTKSKFVRGGRRPRYWLLTYDNLVPRGHPWSIVQRRATKLWYIIDDDSGEKRADYSKFLMGPFDTLEQAKVNYLVGLATGKDKVDA